MTVVSLARAPMFVVSGVRARLTRLAAGTRTSSSLLVIAPTVFLVSGGLIMILSSSWVSAYQHYGSSYLFFKRQLLWAALGAVGMGVTTMVDYRRFRKLGYVLFVASFVGLILVLHPALGTSVSGSSRWMAVGPIRWQPSELAKLALILVGANICTRRGKSLRTWQDVMAPFGVMAAIVGGLVMLQPDLGTTLILGGIVFAVLYVAGARMRVISGMGVSSIGSALALSMSAGYRRARLLSFIDPFKDPLNTGYQAVQSQIALGSGGLFGVGLGASRQKWMYVPNAHTDFIFAIIGEEVGLLGGFVVIGLFGLLAYAGVRVARRAPDAFGRVVAAGITAWIVGQAVLNMGAVTGLLPITGVPLPLISFGGSSLMFTMIALGILTNIARQEKWPQKSS
jgi:cell division protein FtsW